MPFMVLPFKNADFSAFSFVLTWTPFHLPCAALSHCVNGIRIQEWMSFAGTFLHVYAYTYIHVYMHMYTHIYYIHVHAYMEILDFGR
jgi:ABC-type Na+ efflux pump permease subunit